MSYEQHLVQLTDHDEAPDLHTLLQIARDYGLVGEGDTVLSVMVSMVRGRLIVIYGLSRGGKDAVMDAAKSAFPADTVYTWPTDESPTAPYYNAEEIESYPVQEFDDITNLPEHQESILKAFGEGQPATRTFTDVSKAEGEEAMSQEIGDPRTTVVKAASDNRNFSFEDHPEIRKRGIFYTVDSTKQQTERVMKRKAREHAGVLERNVNPMDKMRVRNYMGDIPVSTFVDSADNQIVNPAAEEFFEQKVLPSEFNEARFDFDRLLEFMGTMALINHAERFVVDTDGGLRLMVAPADCWYTMRIMGNNMVKSALNLSDEDKAILQFLKESTAAPSKTEIQQGLRQAGYNINDRDVASSLKTMREMGYVEEHTNATPYTYSVSPFASVTDFEVNLDWESVIERAAERVYDLEEIPESVADAYVDKFCRGSGLIVNDPFTGDSLDIREDGRLQEEVNDMVNEISEVVNGTGSTETEQEADTDGQQEIGGVLGQ